MDPVPASENFGYLNRQNFKTIHVFHVCLKSPQSGQAVIQQTFIEHCHMPESDQTYGLEENSRQDPFRLATVHRCQILTNAMDIGKAGVRRREAQECLCT